MGRTAWWSCRFRAATAVQLPEVIPSIVVPWVVSEGTRSGTRAGAGSVRWKAPESASGPPELCEAILRTDRREARHHEEPGDERSSETARLWTTSL